VERGENCSGMRGKNCSKATVIFFLVIEEPILGAVFAVVTVGAAVLTARFYGRLKKGRAAAST